MQAKSTPAKGIERLRVLAIAWELSWAQCMSVLSTSVDLIQLSYLHQLGLPRRLVGTGSARGCRGCLKVLGRDYISASEHNRALLLALAPHRYSPLLQLTVPSCSTA